MLATHCNIAISTTRMKPPALGSEEQWKAEHTSGRRGRN